jgi:hypothetical protein
MVLFKLKGLRSGIKVEVVGEQEPEPLTDHAQAVVNGIHERRAKEKEVDDMTHAEYIVDRIKYEDKS